MLAVLAADAVLCLSRPSNDSSVCVCVCGVRTRRWSDVVPGFVKCLFSDVIVWKTASRDLKVFSSGTFRRLWRQPFYLFIHLFMMAAGKVECIGCDNCQAWLDAPDLTQQVLIYQVRRVKQAGKHLRLFTPGRHWHLQLLKWHVAL